MLSYDHCLRVSVRSQSVKAPMDAMEGLLQISTILQPMLERELGLVGAST